MILTAANFLNMGFKVSNDTDIIDRAISDAELFWLKNQIGDANYIRLSGTLESGTKDYVAVNGGTYDNRMFAGLKQTIAHVAFCNLLRDNINSVRTGSVQKYDENSRNVTGDDIYDVAKYHSTIAEQYLKEVCELLEITRTKINYWYEW